MEFPAFSNMYLGSDFSIWFCYCCDKCILFLVSIYNSSMEDHAFRFPHLASNIFDQLDNQSLVNCKEVSRKLDNFFGNEKFFWLRIIHEYRGNFVEFKEIWNKTLKKSPAILVKELSLATHNFFEKYSSRIARQWHPLLIPADQGLLQLYEDISEKSGDRNPKFGLRNRTALHLAAQEGQLEICKFIIESTEDKNPRSDKGITPFYVAAQFGHFKVCKFIMNYLEDKNPQIDDTFTPLHEAAFQGHLKICEMILDEIVDKNPTETKDGFTPLHIAAQEGHLEICKLIVKYLIDKNPKKNDGVTPLHSAASKGQMEVCRFLIEVASEKNPRDNQGMTPLSYAMHYKQFKVCKFISKYLAKQEDQNSYGIRTRIQMKITFRVLKILGH